MGDWEDFCNSNGRGLDWEPWNEPGWADDGNEDSYCGPDDQEKSNEYEEEFEMAKAKRDESIIILSNLLERASANKKDFTKMERKAIKHAISVLSESDEYESTVVTEHTTACWGQPRNNNHKELTPPPMDFDDDIPF